MRHLKLTLGVIAVAALLAVPAGIYLNTAPSKERQDNGRFQSSAHSEHQAKQFILQRDVTVTEELCRLQCRVDLTSLAKKLSGTNQPDEIRKTLAEMRQKHPHLHALAYVPPGSERVIDGKVDPGAVEEAFHDALRSVSEGKRYESDGIGGNGEDVFFVLGVPAERQGSPSIGGIVGIVHQDVLTHVANHQKRNLRLREFPDEDKTFGIRAVDPNTGQEIDVNTPEENQGVSHYRKQEIVVRFKKHPNSEQLERIKRDTEAKSMKQLGYAYVIDSGKMSTEELMQYFKAHEIGIEYVEPHYMYVTNGESTGNGAYVPNDELYSKYQWNLPVIETETGWSLTRGAEDVIVAVVDTGVTIEHPDLHGHLVDGYNVVDPAQPPQDDVGHGTHVAGVVAALTDNKQGVAGMTWFNKVMPVKVLDSTGMGSTYSVAEGIIWATDHGAKVINLSLGNYASASFLHDAIRYAFDRDVVLIAATGNDNTSDPGFPAAYPEVLAVSATNQWQEKAAFSNYGDYVDVVAPGEQIASTYMNNQYAALSGTSMASPHVSALAALIRSANPSLRNTEVYDIIRQSAVDLGPPGRDADFGYGQIHVARALQLATGQMPAEAASDERLPKQTIRRESFLDLLFRSIFG